ncbi:MAG: hypothetical protein U0746_17875 [Gemmataceae bacterium]
MRSIFLSLVTLVVAVDPIRADVPAGTWRMTVELGPAQSVVFLVAFENTGGKWVGKYLGSTNPLAPDTSIDGVRVGPDRLQFTIGSRDQRLAFDGKPAGNRVLGTLLIDGQLLITALEPSKLTTFDRYELAKEVFASSATGPLLVAALQELLQQATTKKATVDEVRAWVDRATKSAEPLGLRWQQGIAMGITAALDGQPAFAAIALDEARRAERLIDPADEAIFQLEVVEALVQALKAAGKADEAAALAPRVAELEERDYKEASQRPSLPVDPFRGRAGASERIVLVEGFTSSGLQSAVGPDIAFEALGRAYKSSDVVRLQYHVHFPSSDPLACPAAEARRTYYALAQPPGLALNGKLAIDGQGGSRTAALALWIQVSAVIAKLIEQAPDARIKAEAKRTGEVVAVKATVGVSRPGEKVRLRLALVEDIVRYRGSNGIRFHPSVVRGFIGGDEGIPMTKTSNEVSQTIDLAVVRKTLNALLDMRQKANPDTSIAIRPMALKGLSVVAFVQDDTTREVLQALRVEVK